VVLNAVFAAKKKALARGATSECFEEGEKKEGDTQVRGGKYYQCPGPKNGLSEKRGVRPSNKGGDHTKKKSRIPRRGKKKTGRNKIGRRRDEK